MGEKVTFDPLTRIITVTLAPDVNGDIFLDVKTDLYSDGKEDWATDESLRKLLFPIQAVGGNPLPGSKELGSTFFLNSDWKIRPYEASHRLTVNGNLYSADGEDPFLDTLGTHTVRIMQQVSSLVDSVLQQQDEIEFAAFGNRVTLDYEHGAPGTNYPAGTLEFPSNNWADTLAIGISRGFHNVHVHESYTFGASDVLDGMIIEGDSRGISTFTMTAGVSTAGTIFKHAKLVGDLDGTAMGFDCVLFDGVTGFSGGSQADDCTFSGTTVFSGSGVVTFHDCKSGVPGVGAPGFDFDDKPIGMSVRNWIGGLALINKSSNESVSLDIPSGQCVLDNTVTAGTIAIRDRNNVTDNSDGATVVDWTTTQKLADDHGSGNWEGTEAGGGVVGTPFDPTGVLP